MLTTAHRQPRIADPILDAVVGELVRVADLERIILFGSRARADARPNSDYDLLVVFGAARDAWDARDAAARASKAVRAVTSPDLEVQIVGRKRGEFEANQDQPGTLDWDVAREGIVLWPPDAPPLASRPGLTSTAMLVRERPPEPGSLPTRETIAAWIARADDDLLEIEIHLKRDDAGESVPWSSVAFHSQQAAEKYLKVLLIERGVQPPRTHKLEELVEALSWLEVNLESIRADCTELSGWAVDSRYPENQPFPTRAQARVAAHAALRVVAAISQERSPTAGS